MLCPNCKTELVQINGRFICSDCGKEVSEAEMNVGDWGQSPFENERTVPEPGSVSVGADSVSLDESEDYLEGEQPVSPEPAVVEPVQATLQEEEHSINEKGIYQAQSIGLDIDLPKLQDTLNPPAPTPEAPQTEVSQEPTIVDTPAEVLPVVPNEVVTVPSAPSPKDQLPPVEPTLPEDPEIYKDPLYDMPAVAEPVRIDPKEQSSMPMDKKVVIGLVSAGLLLVVLLIGGGIWAYMSLTEQARVDAANIEVPDAILDCDSVKDTDGKNSCIAENLASCSVAKWTNPRTMASGALATLGYEIVGTASKGCEAEVTLDNSEEDNAKVGESMICILDNSLAPEKAVSGMSKDTCTGTLAESLFVAAKPDSGVDATSN